MGLLGQLAPLLRARRTPPGGASVSTRFAYALREHETERHARILGVTPSSEPSPYRSRMPLGWRAQDVLDLPASSGFMSVEQAATTMKVEEDEIIRLVKAGVLEARGKLVRPALVSVLGVKR